MPIFEILLVMLSFHLFTWVYCKSIEFCLSLIFLPIVQAIVSATRNMIRACERSGIGAVSRRAKKTMDREGSGERGRHRTGRNGERTKLVAQISHSGDICY